MWYDWTKNNKINRLHERCLHLIYNEKKSSFEELMETDSSVSVHNRNLRALATEMYTIYHGISPTIMSKIFKTSLILKIDTPKGRTVNHGSERFRYLSSKI